MVSALIALMLLSSPEGELTLYSVQFPEKRTVELDFSRMSGAPAAQVSAKIRYREGQAQIDLRIRDLKPAVLFGGDVSCYVLWAVTRDGSAENLGEVITFEGDGESEFSTGIKSFALLITAEPYYLVEFPSSLVMFVSDKSEGKRITSTPFLFDALVDKPATEHESILNVDSDKKDSLPLKQAEKAFEFAERIGAKEYAPAIHRDALIALTQAQNLESVSRRRETTDYARRSVSHSNEAIRLTLRKREAIALEQRIASQKAEYEALVAQANNSARLVKETQAANELAQKGLAEANKQVSEAETQLAELSRQRKDMEIERDRLLTERSTLQEQKTALSGERDTLLAEKETLHLQMIALKDEQQTLIDEQKKLREEKEMLNSRLANALSQVAETHDSARGMIVSLPDILFDSNQSELKDQTKVVIAKLAGILLVMTDLNLIVEGHTDALGDSAYNLKLSEKRAQSVVYFLREQGIGMQRMNFKGFGMDQPIADNDSASGRAKNRRVEIVIKSRD